MICAQHYLWLIERNTFKFSTFLLCTNDKCSQYSVHDFWICSKTLYILHTSENATWNTWNLDENERGNALLFEISWYRQCAVIGFKQDMRSQWPFKLLFRYISGKCVAGNLQLKSYRILWCPNIMTNGFRTSAVKSVHSFLKWHSLSSTQTPLDLFNVAENFIQSAKLKSIEWI